MKATEKIGNVVAVCVCTLIVSLVCVDDFTNMIPAIYGMVLYILFRGNK